MLPREAQTLIDTIKAVHPYARFPADAADVWASLLRRIDPTTASQALARSLREGRAIPTPSDIVRISRDIAQEGPGSLGEASEARPPCGPCQRENGVSDPLTGSRLIPQASVVGPHDRHGPNEPLCGWHLEREALRAHLERAGRGALEHECQGHAEPVARALSPKAAALRDLILSRGLDPVEVIVGKVTAREPGEEG